MFRAFESRKAPRARKAGAGYSDPDYDLSVDWIAASDAIKAAQRRHDDVSASIEVLLINGSARSEHTCPGEMSKSSRPMRLATEVLDAVRQNRLSLVTAESCTAGKLAAALSEAPGASERFHGGFVTYTKANKTKALGIPPGLLKDKGAVRSDVAVAMAQGALARSPASLSVAITGVAVPTRPGRQSPRLYLHRARRRYWAPVHSERYYGDLGRDSIQRAAMADALSELIHYVNQPQSLEP